MGDGFGRDGDSGFPARARACPVVSAGHVTGRLGRDMARAIQQTSPTLEHDPWPGIVCGGGIGIRHVSPFRARQFDRERSDDVTGSGLFERIDRYWHVRDSAGLAGDADPVHLGTPARAGNARRTDHSDPNTRKAVKKLSKPLASWRIRQKARLKNSDFLPKNMSKLAVKTRVRRDRERTFEK